MQTLLVDVIRAISYLIVIRLLTSYSLFFFSCFLSDNNLGSFCLKSHGVDIHRYFISGPGKILSYNRLRQKRLVSLKYSFLFGALPLESKQRNSFVDSRAAYSLLSVGSTVSVNTYDLL